MENIGDLLKTSLAKKQLVKKNIHSEAHDLADQICKAYGEPKKFAMWLGLIKRYGVSRVYRAFAEVKQSNAKKPARLLMWKLKQYGNNSRTEAQNKI